MKKGVDGLFKLLNISYKKKMDLTIDVEDYKLNVRATVIIEHNGKILVHRNVNSNHYALMGGRVKIGEDSETTVKREVMEELGKKIEVIGYVTTIENFFEMKGSKYHEILFVHKAEFVDEEDKKIGILNSQLEGILKQIVSECGKGDPLEEEKISQKDLESAKNQTKYQLSELERKIAFSEKAIQKYRENLTALSEYNNFSADEEIHFEQDFKKMSEKELRDFKGMLIRDYNDIIRCVQKCRETLAQTLNKIARQEAFQDASYKTPLENMLKVCDNAAKVLRQLNITLESYDSLMKQLEVDISLVETEKKNVTELLEDYVQNIHKNLEKIGRNSTIKIREKSIKMLKVILPVWEDNEKLYSLRLSDLVDEITEEGIRLFENNENAQEYIGRKVTSKNLYDTVVGTGNVQIQLYKIEEQREQQISWNQVAKNSGGEGFLSAFVILSSLLDYMRKDDSDIFMDKNEGKVLLMDNPFAQTNAEHLLKPLMNLADKTNTQLICLTGLGGESIYNRFDNIYVLNLIEAHLRNGIQYLRPEHKKGEEVKVETILPTHIEVEEMLF